ncbi:aldehyde dehydrogenase family protein, partial [Microbacterium gubbeenense]
MNDVERALLSTISGKLFIAGEWVDATGGATLDVRDPATNEVIAQVADATADDATRALDAAVDAQAEWAATAPRRRSEILRRAWELVQERKHDLALVMTLEMGKPVSESLGEVGYGGEFLRWFSEEAVRISGRYGSTPEGTGQMIVSQCPVGPCFFITPWNFPFAMATRKIAPALAAGCTTVIKPPQLTPLTTMLFVQIL